VLIGLCNGPRGGKGRVEELRYCSIVEPENWGNLWSSLEFLVENERCSEKMLKAMVGRKRKKRDNHLVIQGGARLKKRTVGKKGVSRVHVLSFQKKNLQSQTPTYEAEGRVGIRAASR